jgi:hypothetical protein
MIINTEVVLFHKMIKGRLGMVGFCHLDLIHLFLQMEKAVRQMEEAALLLVLREIRVAVAQHPEVEALFPLEQKVLY